MFTRRYRYRFGDIDHAGIAYYPSLMHYCHCAFEDFWADELGKPYPELMLDDNLGFPAVRLEVDFFVPIRYGDEPEVAVGVLDIGNTSVQFGFWFGLQGRLALRARITTVAVRMDNMQKTPIDDRWRRAFTARLVEDDPFVRS